MIREERAYFSKCTTPACGWLYRHEYPLRDLPMMLRLCGQCEGVLVTATEAEWLATTDPKKKEHEEI
jgi:hypothetical protein